MLKTLLMTVVLLITAGCTITVKYPEQTSSQRPFHEIISMEEYTVHICSSRLYFRENKWFSTLPMKRQRRIDGFVDWGGRSIWMLGRVGKNGKIYPWSYYLAGHEFWHVLNHLSNNIGNPDEDK